MNDRQMTTLLAWFAIAFAVYIFVVGVTQRTYIVLATAISAALIILASLSWREARKVVK